MKPSTATTSRTELDAYRNILSNLKVLAQELQSRDLSESEVTETIRSHLLQMLECLKVGPEGPQPGRA